MKKETIHLIGMIILCIVTIPFVTYAQEQAQKPRRRLVDLADLVEPEPEPELPVTDCGYSRPIKVAGFISNPPFSWVERTDKDTLVTYGYSFDVFKKIAEKLGWQYESVGFTSYDETLGALKRGEIDLILSAYLPQGLGYGISAVYPVQCGVGKKSSPTVSPNIKWLVLADSLFGKIFYFLYKSGQGLGGIQCIA